MKLRKQDEKVANWGPVRFVHVMISAPCDQCDAECLRLGRASVKDGLVDETGFVFGDDPIICNDCQAAIRERDKQEHKKALQQRRWARKAIK